MCRRRDIGTNGMLCCTVLLIHTILYIHISFWNDTYKCMPEWDKTITLCAPIVYMESESFIGK